MPPLAIRTYGDLALKDTARPIGKITARHRTLAADMAETMYEKNGIGLAANQVGVLERIIIVDVEFARAEEDAKPAKNPLAMINPEIIEESVEDESYEEGCLSIPGVTGEVWRPKEIKVRYTDLQGKTHEEHCEGLFARCVQHEVDHLNGVLFIDRMGAIKRRLLSRSLNQLLKKREEQSV